MEFTWKIKKTVALRYRCCHLIKSPATDHLWYTTYQ
nr:MAG TPA: hypothetical protein [Caudoviricetes sp.]